MAKDDNLKRTSINLLFQQIAYILYVNDSAKIEVFRNSLKVLLENKTIKECQDFIKNNSEEVYLVPPGYEVKDIILFGVTSSVGFSGNDILIRYLEPTSIYFSVYKLENEAEEIRKLKEQYKTDIHVKRIK